MACCAKSLRASTAASHITEIAIAHSRRARRVRREQPQAVAKRSAPPRRRCETRHSRRRDRRRKANRPAGAYRICGRRIRAGSFFRSTVARYACMPARDHRVRESERRPLPQRKHRRKAGAGELLLAIGPDVREEKIAEDDVGNAVAQRRGDGLAHPRFVNFIRTGIGDRHDREAASRPPHTAPARFPAARRGSTLGRKSR